MTRNEKIAEKMGWSIWQKTSSGPFPKILYHINNANGYSLYSEYHQFDFNVNCSLEIAHLLIEPMVVDGWDIDVCWSAKTNEIMCVATKCDNGGYIEHRLREADFPTAVVELFCRVYAIPDGE